MRKIESIKDVLTLVIKAGNIAAEKQKALNFSEREFKEDGSVVTKVDRMVEDLLCEKIVQLFPDVNFITEEKRRDFNDRFSYSFVVDPIDGTDSFSNYSPVWAVSVALCDSGLNPIAGIVYAPRLDCLFFADIGQIPTLNSIALKKIPKINELNRSSMLMVHPNAHRELDLKNFVGKVRCFGSTALHLCVPSFYPTCVGALGDPRIYIWDVAAAHAIASASGCEFCYFNGDSIDYRAVFNQNYKMPFFVASTKPGALELLQASVSVMPLPL